MRWNPQFGRGIFCRCCPDSSHGRFSTPSTAQWTFCPLLWALPPPTTLSSGKGRAFTRPGLGWSSTTKVGANLVGAHFILRFGFGLGFWLLCLILIVFVGIGIVGHVGFGCYWTSMRFPGFSFEGVQSQTYLILFCFYNLLNFMIFKVLVIILCDFCLIFWKFRVLGGGFSFSWIAMCFSWFSFEDFLSDGYLFFLLYFSLNYWIL